MMMPAACLGLQAVLARLPACEFVCPVHSGQKQEIGRALRRVQGPYKQAFQQAISSISSRSITKPSSGSLPDGLASAAWGWWT